jgi:hypothetical protein
MVYSRPKGLKKNFSRWMPGVHYYWLGPLLFFFFHFATWPIFWHGVILPHTRSYKHQLRVESHFPNRVVDTRLYLDNPHSTLTAYAVWQVPKKGLYHFRLSCDDNGKLKIDNRTIITLRGISPNNQGEAKHWLTPGPHFLELHLNNILEKGWLNIEVAGPGQGDLYSPLNIQELSFLELRNINFWVNTIIWGEYLCFLGFLGLIVFWLGIYYFRRWAGKIFPNQLWKNFFLALTVFALTLSIVYFSKHPIPPIYGDGLGYYAYLPSYLIYHDPTIESIFQPLGFYDYHCGGEFERYPATGRYLVWFPIGTAVLMLPFFLMGHLFAPLLGSAPDGFSIVYQFAIIMASIFYMLVGLVLLFKILIRNLPPKVVLATLLSIFLGTNFLAFAAITVSLSHIYSFFLVSWLLYLVPRWYAEPSRGKTFIVGMVAGLIYLVRSPNVLLLLIIPLYGIVGWDTFKERLVFLWQEKQKVLLLIFCVILFLLPQIVISWLATDQLLFNPYSVFGGRFHFLSPQIVKVLFSPYHGFLIWSPILVFSFLGLWKMEGFIKLYRLPIIICLILHLYLVSSWADPSFGWSFGQRAFVDVLGLYALPLAAFYMSLKRTLIRRGVMVISTFFIILTCYSFLQFYQGVLPGEMSPPMNWRQYRNIMLNPEGFVELWHWLKDPRFNNHRLSR